MSTESAFAYDGPLSTYREWHSIGFGAMAGVVAGWSRTIRQDIRTEPQYFIVGVAIGAFIGTRLRGD